MRTKGGRRVLQMVLGSAEELRVPNGTVLEAHPGRCAGWLRSLSRVALEEALREAAWYRFERKRISMMRTTSAHGEGEGLYQGLARALGYAGNEVPFLLLSQRVPLQDIRTRIHCAEACLFGVSGLMPHDLNEVSSDAREMVRRWWDVWWKERGLTGRIQVERSLWRIGQQRPMNHPERRIGVFTVLVTKWKRLVELASEGKWKELRMLLLELQHPFWMRHYTLRSREVRKPMRLLGRERVVQCLENVFFPAFGDWAALCEQRVLGMNRRYRIAMLRMLPQRTDLKEVMRWSVCQQGLLEWYTAFCARDASGCVECVFPEQREEAILRL